MAIEPPQVPRRSRRPAALGSALRALRWPWLAGALVVLGLMAASFFAGWVLALGPVGQALAQLHRDIQAVQSHRPLIVHPLNWWSGLGGFVLGMLVMSFGNHWLKARPKLLDPLEAPRSPDDGEGQFE